MLHRKLISITKSTKKFCCCANCTEHVWHCACCSCLSTLQADRCITQSLSTRITNVSIALCLPACLPWLSHVYLPVGDEFGLEIDCRSRCAAVLLLSLLLVRGALLTAGRHRIRHTIVVSTFRDWSRWVAMWLAVSFPHTPAVSQITQLSQTDH